MLLGIDIGTTHIKACLYTLDGELIAINKTLTPKLNKGQGMVVYRPADILETIKDVVVTVSQSNGQNCGKEIQAIAISSQGESGLLVDEDNNPLTDIIAWYDKRTLSLSEEWFERIETDELITITGLNRSHIYSLLKIEWLKQNDQEVYKKADKWHCLSDYVTRYLSGIPAMDYSVASRTMAFDIRQKAWSEKMLELAGVSEDLMPELYPAGTPLGTILPEIADRLGINHNAVVTVGGWDHVCGCFGISDYDTQSIIASIGTTESLCFIHNEFPRQIPNGFVIGSHVVPDQFYELGGMPSGGKTIDWAIKTLLRKEPSNKTYLEFNSLARNSPAGSNGVIFLPHLDGCVSPIVDDNAKGTFLGITSRTTIEDLCRSVVEGLCHEFKLILEEHPQGNRVDRLTCIGGGAKNEFWMELKAHFLNMTIQIPDVNDAVTLGVSKLARLGLKNTNRSRVSSNINYKVKTFYPNQKQYEYYKKIHDQVYKHIYKSQKDLLKRLTSITNNMEAKHGIN